ncbi:hypothetical protein CF651_26810 [Paenibacillus rigui]|uniref:Multi-TM2 domain-containing protein n=2 Tax=Paenibacillus rigui TaxID=554312 RepID=A0A229UJ71_9BACL|nr:hypothetical protein [Paenibacillus rigui]OXM83335.1 hypothetical protein CF651_26810 [Paenibacillus rigui]
MQYKNPMAALLLSFIPGAGHLYMNRKGRAFLYGAGFFGPMMIIFLLLVTGEVRHADEFLAFLLVIAFLAGLINLIDMIIYLLKDRDRRYGVQQGERGGEAQAFGAYTISPQGDNERMFTVFLSLIPGLGHFHLGLMQRGLAFLMAFFGSLVMIIFVTALTHREGFLAFLGVLPVIWLYCMFDCIQQLNKKKNGLPLVDQTMFEDFQDSRQDGKKSKMIATFLSIVPGAGHMYIGLQKRGLQLMVAFFLCIYIMDVLRLSIFLFLIPILWFYSFFDALQQISKQGQEEIKDVPFVDWLINHQKWVGIVLLLLGLYYLTDEVLLSTLDRLFPKERISAVFHQYFQTFIVSVLLIGGGLKLVMGSQGKNKNKREEG